MSPFSNHLLPCTLVSSLTDDQTNKKEVLVADPRGGPEEVSAPSKIQKKWQRAAVGEPD